MKTLREYIFRHATEENHTKNKLNISWKLHKTITLADVILISLNMDKFTIDKKYTDYFESRVGTYYTVNIMTEFENHENIALLYLVMHPGYNDKICINFAYDAKIPVFSSEYLDQYSYYIHKYELEHNLVGQILDKLGFYSNIKKDGTWYTMKYFQDNTV